MGKFWWKIALIVVAGCWAFWPVLHGSWLMDDDYYILYNQVLRDPMGLVSIWLSPGSLVEYYPIESSVQWIQFQCWGEDTLGYHATNIVLHVISALLVWRFLDKLKLRLAWLGGLLFAIHPMTVESVAWMAELKNTLSLPPFLLAMCAWVDFENHRETAPRSADMDYAKALGFFILAMLCKITMVLFPVVILLYAWWKRDRIRWGDLKAAAPFAVISAVLIVVTIVAGEIYSPGNALAVTVPLYGILPRLAVAGLALAFYLLKCLVPVELLPLYPHWKIDPPEVWQFLPWPAFAAVAIWLWVQRRRAWARHLLLGLGFFFLNLMPFVGFRDISFMRFTWVMDHFVYLPMIGLVALIVAGMGYVDRRLSAASRPYAMGFLAFVFALLAWETHEYAGKFTDQGTLWTYEIEHNPDSWVAENNLGVYLHNKGQLVESEKCLRRALEINPEYGEAHNNLGLDLFQRGQVAEARMHFAEAVRISPDYGFARDNLAAADAALAAGKK